jgi:hypothetical protein
MMRKVVVTKVDAVDINRAYDNFNDGWKLDPWLHNTNRPWTVAGGPMNHPMYVWNFIKFEETDQVPKLQEGATEFERWIAGESPVLNMPTPKLEVTVKVEEDPVVAELLIDYNEVAALAAKGWEMPEDKRWAKNRLAVLRRSNIGALIKTDIGLPTVRALLDTIDLNEISDYVKARAEHEELSDEE